MGGSTGECCQLNGFLDSNCFAQGTRSHGHRIYLPTCKYILLLHASSSVVTLDAFASKLRSATALPLSCRSHQHSASHNWQVLLSTTPPVLDETCSCMTLGSCGRLGQSNGQDALMRQQAGNIAGENSGLPVLGSSNVTHCIKTFN